IGEDTAEMATTTKEAVVATHIFSHYTARPDERSEAEPLQRLMHYPAMRLIPILILCALSGCSLFGADFDDLDPGTFRMKADGKEMSGQATYYPERDLASQEPLVFLESDEGDFMFIRSEAFLNAISGQSVTPRASYRPLTGGVFTRRSGRVE